MAAKSLHELEQLMSDADLGGPDVGADDQQAVETHRMDVQRIDTLKQALKSGDRKLVSAAVQVFEDLGTLEKAVETTEKLALGEIEKLAKEALDVSLPTSPELGKPGGAPGRAALPSPGTSGNVRTRLWENLELFQECVFENCAQIELLETVLMEHHARGFDTLSEDFGNKVMTLFLRTLLERAEGSSFVKQTLEDEYPKILRIFLDFRKKSQALGDTFVVERDILQPFENAYLSRSLSRLLDPVQTMFSGDPAVLGRDDVEALIGIFTSELSVSLVDEGFSTVVAQNIAKAILLFRQKCEEALVTGEEAYQVMDSPTPGQQHNIVIASLLYYLEVLMNRDLDNLGISLPGGWPNKEEKIIEEALYDAVFSTYVILRPLCCSINDVIMSIILTMHDDTEFRDPTSPLGRKIGGSLYMCKLQDFIAHSFMTFLAPYKFQAIVNKCCKLLASRCVEFFVRHACLVRPLTDYGRAKLIADVRHMHVTVAPLFYRDFVPGILDGRERGTLRVLKALLCLGSEGMIEKFLEGEGKNYKGYIPASLVLLFLISGAPAELQSPHESLGWSITEMSQWMDEHESESELLALCTEPLQRYQSMIRARNPPTFHHTFPLMMKLANLEELAT